ncbi:hypothetical protein EBU94_02680 [bacterium]|nr:hypothetical protein [bacterium]
MKRIKLFESDIKGNPGIPGEPTRKEGESSYISDVTGRARQRLGIRPGDVTMQGLPPSRKMVELGIRMMELVMRSQRDFIRGHERQLEELGERLFRNLYQEIIDRYNILLDLKISQPRLNPPEGDDDTPLRKIDNEEVINQIHKRKLANLIIQGEAKNTKHILHLEECKDGLKEIYGNRKGEEAFRIFDEMTKTADQMDWIIDIWIRKAMMEQDPNGSQAAGSVEVEWVKKEDEDIELKEYDPNDTDEDDEDEFMGDLFPKIRARAIDFPMLLHESVKGLFEILSLGGIPEDEEVATKVLSNTGRMDEPEDWQFGPEVAADVRDFVNENPNIDKYPNIREELFKLMVDKETMPVKDFLELMRGILSKTPKARRDVDRLIKQIIDGFDSYDKDLQRYNREMEEYNRELKNYEDSLKKGMVTGHSEIDNILKKQKPQRESEEDYSTYSQSQLQSMMDDALDNNDFDKVKKISQFMKESRSYRR